MLVLLYYCLKVIICSGLLFGYYLLALRNNRFHQWNRYYLLAVIIVSFTLPLLKIPVPFLKEDEQPVIQSFRIIAAPDIYFSKLQLQEYVFNWPMIIGLMYGLIVLFLICFFIRNVFGVLNLKKLYPCENLNGIHFYNTSEPGTPFSFFKNIFWNSGISLNNEKGQQMLRHEVTHVQEKHSIDKVLMELLLAFAWWNLFLYYIRKELAVIHEFIADQKASAGDDNLQYASLLLMKAMGSEQYALGNPFFHTQLKRRLIMLTTNKNPKLSYLRRLMVLPLAVIAVVLFSFKYKQENSPQKNKGQSTESSGRLQKQTLEEGLAVHGFYQDTAKKKTTGKEQQQYKGKFIESLTPTTDGKGIIVRTTDRAVYFLSRDEAKKELNVVITDAGIVAPPGTRVTPNIPYHLQAAMPGQGKIEVTADDVSIDNSDQTLHLDNGSIQIHKSGNGSDDFDKALIILDGVRLDPAKIKDLDIKSFDRMDVLKGNSATALYGDDGKNGVIVITTKKTVAAEPLYVIDGVESTKKQMTDLDPAAIQSVNVLKAESVATAYGEKGKNGVIVITTKLAKNEVTMPEAGQSDGLRDVTVIGYKTKPAFDRVFTTVEEPASFPGGSNGWARYLERNLMYPEEARKNNTQGEVKVKMTVDEDGLIAGIEALNNPGNGLAEEAVRVIKKGPKWIPAKQNGKIVKYTFVQTIHFGLQ